MKKFGKVLAVFSAVACLLTAVASVLPSDSLRGDGFLAFVFFGSIGLTFFWFQIRGID